MDDDKGDRTRRIVNIFLLTLFVLLYDQMIYLIGPVLTNLFLILFAFHIFFGLKNLWDLLRYNFISKSRSGRKAVQANKNSAKPKSRFGLSSVSRLVWGFFAVCGILIIGIFVGASTQGDYNKSESSKVQSEQKAKLNDVLQNYQGLSKLFYLQSQDMDILTDPTIWQDDPQQFTDTLNSYHQEKDEILFQWGRLYELRKKAGLPDDPNLKVE